MRALLLRYAPRVYAAALLVVPAGFALALYASPLAGFALCTLGLVAMAVAHDAAGG